MKNAVKKMNKMEKKRKSNALQNDQIANILWKNYDSHIFRMIATSSYIKIRICSIWYVFYDNEIEIRRKKKLSKQKKFVRRIVCIMRASLIMFDVSSSVLFFLFFFFKRRRKRNIRPQMLQFCQAYYEFNL